MIISYEGHACFVLQGSKKIIIDPFLVSDIKAPQAYEDQDYDLILVTHGHRDHFGDAVRISKNSGAPIITVVELANILAAKGLNAVGFNIGGTYRSGEVRIKMTPALHSSSIRIDGQALYAGPPVGFIIRMDGLCIYYPGDTALFYDMATVIAREKIDRAFLPIGDYFTMGMRDAVTAADWLGAKKVIPMHYNTFPEITQNVNIFAQEIAEQTDSECIVMKPGEKINL